MAMVVKPAVIAIAPTNAVNGPLTIRAAVRSKRWQRAPGSGNDQVMTDRTPLAGGCFLTVTILAGFLIGLSVQQPVRGVLAGTAIGAVLAMALWLVDRRRRRG